MMRSIEEMGVSAWHNSRMTADQVKQNNAARIPLQRYGKPEEVGKMMLFLASDESSYCTGGVYMVDGGISAS
jgi:NAD(P)-dependent dehydrogenase (short-subunit alcohol dehydrogenase family)